MRILGRPTYRESKASFYDRWYAWFEALYADATEPRIYPHTDGVRTYEAT
jgi:hypothetical protein